MNKNIFSVLAVAAFLTATLSSCEDETVISGVKLDRNAHTIVVETGFTLTATTTPSGANNDLRWLSNRPIVADVDDNGNVTSFSVGETTIFVIAADGVRDSCVVTVRGKPASSVAVSRQSLPLKIGEIQVLTATVEPELADNKNVTWSSSPPGIVIVEDGVVRAIAHGTATVTATTVDGGLTDNCVVSVENVYFNLIANPGFEDPDGTNAALTGWNVVSANWFTAFYANDPLGPGIAAGSSDRIGLPNNEGFFLTGNGNYFHTHRIGNWCGRLPGNTASGIFQNVDVLPGAKYRFSALIGMRCNDDVTTLRDWETVKFLSADDGLTVYHEIPIPLNDVFMHNNRPTIVERVEGTVEIPANVTSIRILLDQRNFNIVNEDPDTYLRAPLMLVDDFFFNWISD